MKKLLLLTLTFGISVSTFAQLEIPKKDNAGISDKWVITPVAGMKGVLGRLNINFPNVERNILIHRQADNEFLKSVSRNDKIFTFAPGEYRFYLSSVPINNVPIIKGNETRLKAGLLAVIYEGDWFLYDESKETLYTTGNKPKTMPLPVGNYQIKMGGQFYPVTIVDKEMVENYSEIKFNDSIIVQAAPELTENDHWAITPGNIPDGKGRLFIKTPPTQTVTISNPVTGNNQTIQVPGLLHPTCIVGYNGAAIELPIDLSPGVHGIAFAKVGFSIPIRKGHETRLKAGFLVISFNRAWELKRKQPDGTSMKVDFGDKSKVYALPPGEYTLQVFGITGKYFSTIIDGGIVQNGKQN